MAESANLARANMIEAQIRANDVTDPRIHAALDAVPRERFVPSAQRALAYADVPVEVAPGRFLLDPRSFAKALQLVRITADDKVLDVGCATGYSAAVLARLAAWWRWNRMPTWCASPPTCWPQSVPDKWS